MQSGSSKLHPQRTRQPVQGKHIRRIGIGDRYAETDILHAHFPQLQQDAKPFVEPTLPAAELVILQGQSFDADTYPYLRKLLRQADDALFNHPEVEMTTRGDLRNATSTISSKSSLMKGSPPVILINFTLGSLSISAGPISSLLSVGFCHILHIRHCIGQR